MNHAFLLALAGAWLLPAAPAHADNCEPIRASIEARMRAGGLPNPQLQVVDAAGTAPGRVVGICGSGLRKIVYTGAGPATAAATVTAPAAAQVHRTRSHPVARKDDNIPTECRDGTVVMGPNCHDPQAVRLAAVGNVAVAAGASAPAAAASASPEPPASR